MQLSDLFKEPNTLTPFVHPNYNQRFEVLTIKQIVSLAKKVSKEIIFSGYKQILVVETGASPFARICEDIIKQKGKSIKWKYIKFPREPTKDIFPIIKYCSGKKEKRLKQICKEISHSILNPRNKPLNVLLKQTNNKQNKYQKEISLSIEGTEISNFLSKPFLLFEDYITSGHTLNILINYLKFFTKNLDFKIISYYVNVPKSKNYSLIQFSLFDLDSKLKCYQLGVYPFENRIDLFGYFYYIDNKDYKKIKIESLTKTKKQSNAKFLQNISNIIKTNNLLTKIKSKFKIRDVRDFISEEHLLRYFFYVFEKELNKNKYCQEFLWLASDMYGPLWSPLPIKYHIEFMNVFEKNYNLFKKTKGFDRLLKDYGKNRTSILSEISSIFITRRRKLLKTINNILKHGN